MGGVRADSRLATTPRGQEIVMSRKATAGLKKQLVSAVTSVMQGGEFIHEVITGGKGDKKWSRPQVYTTQERDSESMFSKKYIDILDGAYSVSILIREHAEVTGADLPVKKASKVKTVAIKDAEYAEFKAFQEFKASQA